MGERHVVERLSGPLRLGSSVVWALIWILTGVVLHGAPGAFGAMVAVLAVGSVLGLGVLDLPGTSRRHYVIGQLVMWAGLIAATVVVLAGSGRLVPELLVLGAGMAWDLAVSAAAAGRRERGRRPPGPI